LSGSNASNAANQNQLFEQKRTLTMLKKTLISIAALVVAAPAVAHDYTNDLFCAVTDNTGRKVAWTFANNSDNADGSIGGTMVQTAFSRNGKFLEGQVGSRPVWIMFANQAGGLTLLPRNDRGWALVISDIYASNSSQTEGKATLYHNSNVIGIGECARRTGMTSGTIGDVTPE
jgi:hypothetical protein